MAGNLEFITSESTSSNTTNLTLTNCFSDEYDVYKVIYGVKEVNTELATETRLLNASGAVTSSTYQHAIHYMAAGASWSQGGDVNNDKFQYTMYNEGSVGGYYVMYVYNPADSSSFTFANWQMASSYLASSTRVLMARKGIGVLKVAEAHTGIQVYALSSNITKSRLTVYGIK